MPILQQGPGISQPSTDSTQTVQDALQCASLLLRGVLNPFDGATSPTDFQLLMQMLNAIHLDLLRHSRWSFLLTGPMTYITTPTLSGATTLNNNYWLGASLQNPNLTIDTTLNLQDLDIIKRDTVIDRSNQHRLANSELEPVSQTFLQPGKPKIWELLSNAPSVMTLWPPPDAVYFIEFRYYKKRNNLVLVTDSIQIPDRYKDIVCHGVTWLGFQYLKDNESASLYKELYQLGKQQMVKDMNLHPRAEEFVRPDFSAIVSQSTSGVGLDSGIETSIP